MNSFSVRTLARQAVLWTVLVVVVTLLTLLFTVLGTITGAVLTGMMMGAARHRRWQTLPVSLVFPGVVLALVHAARVELLGSQRILLPALCFGAFWLVYLFTRLLVRIETRTDTAPHAAAPAESTAASRPAARAEARGELTEPVRELQLAELQGKWSSETAARNGDARRKIIEMSGSHLSLSVVETDGRVRLVAEGDLKLERSAPAKSRTSGPRVETAG